MYKPYIAHVPVPVITNVHANILTVTLILTGQFKLRLVHRYMNKQEAHGPVAHPCEI